MKCVVCSFNFNEKTKLVLKDGSAIPDWVEFDPVTGEISVNLPDDIDKLEFKLINQLKP